MDWNKLKDWSKNHKKVLLMASGGGLGVLALAAAVSFFVQGPTTHQPVQFNHQFHTQMLACADCHQQVTRQENAGRPDISVCAGCHAGMVSQKPEAQKIVAYVARNENPPWVRMTRLAHHVRFSHRRHVVGGGVACESCHGGIGNTVTPPPRPLVQLNMNFCLDCHNSSKLWLPPGHAVGLSPTLAALTDSVAGKRFAKLEDLMHKVEEQQGSPLAEPLRQELASAVRQAPKVSTDCNACHR